MCCGTAGLPDNKESIQLGFAGMEGKYPSEEDCPGYEGTATQFSAACLQLAQLLLSAFATGLGFPSDFFAKVGAPLFGLGTESPLYAFRRSSGMSLLPENGKW